MSKYVTYIAFISLSAILFLFTSSSLASGGEPYYEPGEIVPTPVPVEVVKRAVMDSNWLKSDSEDTVCKDMWGPYVDCELYPVYDENDIPVEYLVLAYRERSERLGMFDMIERMEPYWSEMRKLDCEKAMIEREGGGLSENRRYIEIKKEMEDLREKNRDSRLQYGWGYIGGIYELPPGLSQFHNGCVPLLFVYYYKAIDKLKREYNTDDVEFVCLRTLRGYGRRGWEFRVDNKRLYVSVVTGPGSGGEPRGKIYIKEMTPDMRSFLIDKYDESYRELWKKYESDGVF